MFDRSNIRTLRDLVYTASDRFGDEPFMRWKAGKELRERSFNMLRRDSDAVASWIEKEFPGGVHGALIGATSYEYVVAWFGLAASGNVAVPLAAVNNAAALADEINRSDTEIVFLDKLHEKELDEFKELCPRVKYFVHITGTCEGMVSLHDITAEFSGGTPKAEIDAAQLAAIIFTSGTTGQSKGVMLSHANLVDNATCEPDRGYHGDKRLSVLPVHHIFCFVCDICATFWYGRTICVNDSLMRIVKNIKLFKPKQVTVVPMIAASILNKMRAAAEDGTDKLAIGKATFGEDFDVLYAGGSYLSPQIIDGYAEFGIAVAQGYGMTECAARVSTGVKGCPKPEAVGRLVPGCRVKTVDGELWVKSPSVMMGYYKNPEETAKTLTPDGWLKTGDLGYADEDGYIHLTGRKKNLIILSNGENVSPEELENMFALMDPIKEIVVFDDNDVLTAEVYPNPDYETDDIKAAVSACLDSVNEKLPTTKQIRGLLIRDTEFEKTASKKIKRSH